jgi:hypothetical protein
MMPKDEDETITVSKADLAAMLEAAKRDAAMDPEEKKVRSIIREEVEDVVKGVLGSMFSSDDDDDDETDNTPGGVKGFLGIAAGS